MGGQPIQAEHVDCNLCGGSRRGPGKWPVLRYLDCGLAYTNPRSVGDSPALFYPSDYQVYKGRRKSKVRPTRDRLYRWALSNHWNYPPHRSSPAGRIFSWPVMLWLRTRWRNGKLFPWEGQRHLLDFGCGSGRNIGRYRHWGWNAVGMDMSEQGIAACREAGIEAYVGFDPSRQFEPAAFDAVTIIHVFEHVPNPTEMLVQIARVLKSGGKLMIVVPNFGSAMARRCAEYWFALDVHHHFYHYDKKTIAALLEKTGFGVEKIAPPYHGKMM